MHSNIIPNRNINLFFLFLFSSIVSIAQTVPVGNRNIVSRKVKSSISVKSKIPAYTNDIRNPIAFTTFLVRNPRTNGKGVIITPNNMSSHCFIRPGSNILIEFDDSMIKHLPVPPMLAITAYLKRKDESVVPIRVDQYFDVSLSTNSADFEKSARDNQPDSGLSYKYSIKSHALPPLPAEISSANLNAQEGDRIIVNIVNTTDGGVSFTSTFEFENFGWTQQATGGFSWVSTIGDGSKKFYPAGSAGVSFYYKHESDARFVSQLFSPGFGPELNVLQNESQTTVVGLGISVSEFLKTVKFGFGWYLTGNNQKPYFSIGVNFIQGFQAVSALLKNVQTSSPGQ